MKRFLGVLVVAFLAAILSGPVQAGLAQIRNGVEAVWGGQILVDNATTGQAPLKQADGSWQPGAPTPAAHALLSAQHSDTAASGVTRGDLVVGSAAGAWDDLAAGGSGTFLRSDGTDLAYAAITSADWSGVVALAQGGTNATTAAGARASLDVQQLDPDLTALAGATLTYGQVPIGGPSGTVTAATITTGTGITVTPGAGSITIAATAANPTLAQTLAAGNSDTASGLSIATVTTTGVTVATATTSLVGGTVTCDSGANARATLSATTGYQGPDGSVVTPAVRGTDGNTGLVFGADVFTLSVGGGGRIGCDTLDFYAATMLRIRGFSLAILPRTVDWAGLFFGNSLYVITNTGAAGAVNIALPAAAAAVGANYEGVVDVAQYLRFTAAAGDVIRSSSATSADAGYIRSNAVGSTLRLVALDGTTWQVMSLTGTWTIDS